ncbi:MAG: hypothetical protein N2259_02965 [Patescibacteria group bacterium]|nr:hypothetical protein [Patescibacteria group bacterium]
MLDLTTISSLQLKTPSFIEELKKEINEMIRRFNSRDAFLLSQKIKEKTAEDPSLREVYKEIIPQLEFIAIGFLNREEIVRLIKEHFKVLLNFPFDSLRPFDLIRYKFSQLPFIEHELLRMEISKALKENENVITKRPIVLEKGGTFPPTIKNWLIDYETRLEKKPDRALARTEYLTNSPNINSLSPQEKEKIEELIKIYDYVNTCSLFPSAYSQDLIVYWPEKTIFVISQGETIVSLPPIEEVPPWSKPTLIEKNEETEQEDRTGPEERSMKPNPLEKKYLEEEKSETFSQNPNTKSQTSNNL